MANIGCYYVLVRDECRVKCSRKNALSLIFQDVALLDS